MKPGDTVENAIWLSGKETTGDLSRYSHDVEETIRVQAETDGMIIGPIKSIIKYPGGNRVPEVPDHIQGPDVRLLVYEADVLGLMPMLRLNSFLNEQDPIDLMRLRKITRDVHHQQHPDVRLLTDNECDDIIEKIGPESASRAVREAVDSHMVH